MPIAIIAGTAIYNIPSIQMEEKLIQTAYGEALILLGQGKDRDLVFLPRHGPQHTTPPHKVNYRANIQALVDLGVKYVLAAYAVGSINEQIPPLGLVALDDFIDFTRGREATFFEGGVGNVKHVDMSQPFCPVLRAALLEKAPKMGLELRPSGTYVCTNGPRLESPAEIQMFKKLGGDVVGMTAVPELVLAREKDLCFAAVGFSVNWAAGIQQKVQFVEHGLDELSAKLLDLFVQTLREVASQEVPLSKSSTK
jgi:5'-methylthioadenosine phosphorylase